MKGKKQLSTAYLIIFILMLSSHIGAFDYWQAPFDTTDISLESTDSVLSLDDVLMLVAKQNPLFQSYHYRIKSAQSNLKQAELWSNPELALEFEEVGWDAPGFKQSELTVLLSQEFEFFGQRKARKKVYEALYDDTKLRSRQSIFDLYLITKHRFYVLAHAQQKVNLSQLAVELTQEIVENINIRLNKGATLQSELLLARIEAQRTLLELAQAKQELKALESGLVALWNGEPSGIQVIIETEPNLSLLFETIFRLTNQTDSTREIIQLDSENKLLRAENRLAKTEARPSVTLSGGFKRFESDNSKSFLFGVSLPIPFFNRNQGTQKSIDAQLRSLEYKVSHLKNEVQSNIESHTIRLSLLKDSQETLDTLLIPTAEHAYQSLKKAYETGRVPYTHLLEAERTLNELSFERNDMLLAIHEQIIEFERLTGVVLRTEREN